MKINNDFQRGNKTFSLHSNLQALVIDDRKSGRELWRTGKYGGRCDVRDHKAKFSLVELLPRVELNPHFVSTNVFNCFLATELFEVGLLFVVVFMKHKVGTH